MTGGTLRGVPPSIMQTDLFYDIADVLDGLGVVWWLSDGAALGCVREGGWVATDADVDIGLWADDEPEVRRHLDGAGWQPHPRSIDPTYVRHGVKLDLHGHVRDGGSVWFALGAGKFRYRFPGRLFDRFETRQFLGRTVLLPSPPADYLAAHYGPDWQTPKGRWRWNVDPPCLEVVAGG